MQLTPTDIDQINKISRQWRFKFHGLTRDGMIELEFPGMQHLSGKHLPAPVRRPSVTDISEQGVPGFTEMYANLVGTPRWDLDLDKLSIFKRFADPIPGQSRLPPFGNRFHEIGPPLPGKKR